MCNFIVLSFSKLLIANDALSLSKEHQNESVVHKEQNLKKHPPTEILENFDDQPRYFVFTVA